MSNTLTQNVFLPPWITKPQSSTGLNWGSETMLFYSCLLLLDRCREEMKKISRAEIVYDLDFSPSVAAKTAVLESNGESVNVEIFNRILKNERE